MKRWRNTTYENINYYPFGMVMPGRSWKAASADGYRFGFNGKENDDAIKGDDNSLDFGARVYDPRLGKFLSLDPLSNNFPWNSPYDFAENRVIQGVDRDGKGFEYYGSMVTFNLGVSLSSGNGFSFLGGIGFAGGENIEKYRLVSAIEVGYSMKNQFKASFGLGSMINMGTEGSGFPTSQTFGTTSQPIVNDYVSSFGINGGGSISEANGSTLDFQLSFKFSIVDVGGITASLSGSTNTNIIKTGELDVQSGGADFSFTPNSQIGAPLFINPSATIGEEYGDRAISFKYSYDKNQQIGFENKISVSASLGTIQGLGGLNKGTQFGSYTSIPTTSPNFQPNFNYISGKNISFNLDYSFGTSDARAKGVTGTVGVGAAATVTGYSDQ